MEFTPVTLVFAIMTLFVLGGGLGVVISRNLFHAALYLVLALFGISGLFILLEAPFLAAVQILVYVGAISVLITITIMVTRRVMGVANAVNTQWPLSAVAAVLVLVTLGFVSINIFGGLSPVADVPPGSIEQIGASFANPLAFMLPFEVASVLLLAALVGAIVVARE